MWIKYKHLNTPKIYLQAFLDILFLFVSKMRAELWKLNIVQLAIGGGSRTFGFLGFIMSAIVPVFLSCIIPLYYYVTTYFTNDMHSGAKH